MVLLWTFPKGLILIEMYSFTYKPIIILANVGFPPNNSQHFKYLESLPVLNDLKLMEVFVFLGGKLGLLWLLGSQCWWRGRWTIPRGKTLVRYQVMGCFWSVGLCASFMGSVLSLTMFLPQQLTERKRGNPKKSLLFHNMFNPIDTHCLL